MKVYLTNLDLSGLSRLGANVSVPRICVNCRRGSTLLYIVDDGSGRCDYATLQSTIKDYKLKEIIVNGQKAELMVKLCEDCASLLKVGDSDFSEITLHTKG